MQSWNATTVFHLYLDELFETSQGIFLAKEARQAIATHLNRESLNLDKDAERAVNTAMKSVANIDRKSTRLNSSHVSQSRMPSSA